MNNWNGIGNLTRDVDFKDGDTPVAKFTVAIDSGFGDKKKTDFIPITCFGKTATNCAEYLGKGKKVGVTGRYATGSYKNKEDVTVYTSEIIADRVEFLSSNDKKDSGGADGQGNPIPEGFYQALEDDPDSDIPF